MESCNEWLYYDGRKAPVYYLCGYIPGSIAKDAISQKILSFKAGDFEAKHFWLDRVLIAYQDLFTKNESNLIIRSIAHNELDVDLNSDYKNPLGYICYRTAKTVNCRYAAGMIYKRKVTPALKTLNKDERWNMVKDNFGLSQFFMPFKNKTVWFVDDIITTGATARATWKALLDFYPDLDFRVIALARTVRDQDYNLNLHILNKEIQNDNLAREEENNYFSKKLEFLNIKFDNCDTFFDYNP